MEERAVLTSGGLDSAILVGTSVKRFSSVFPIYIHCGLYWESTEFDYLRRYLHAIRCPQLQPLTILAIPVADLYGSHWSVTGKKIPDAASPDAEVFLPGRNLLLLSKALLWCGLNGIPRLALGCLGTSPFADARPEFFAQMQKIACESVPGTMAIELPFARMNKTEVMQLGRSLPLQHSFSCFDPQEGMHCGVCNKCAERKRAFAEAGMNDPTEYKTF